ncbi:MAG: LamG-like jellyroll fold domain-containing protein, partial [Sphingomonadales bacterium]
MTVANAAGCSASDSTFLSLVNANIINNDTTICLGASVRLSIDSVFPGRTMCDAAQFPSNLRNGLVGYWPFCGNANDRSGSGNNGIVSGAVLSTDRFGNPNSAYTFDGINDFIETPFRNHLPSFTISAWVKLASPACFSAIVDAYDSSWEFLTDCNGGTNLSFAFWTSAVSYIIYPSNYNLSSGSWTHVVCTFDNGNTCKIYANGILQATISTTNLRNTAGNFYFGRSRSGSSQFLNGSLDDILIWSRALSAAEVSQIYTSAPTITWSPGGATSNSITVSPTQTTNYTVTVTDGIGTCTDSVRVTVTPPPTAGTLSGTQSLCVGSTSTFTSTATGGTWSSSNSSVATINATTGLVTALTAGTATMTYTVPGTGGCLTATATRSVTITAAPTAGTLSGTQSLCVGSTSTFTSTATSGTWSSSNAAVATINATTGLVTALAPGTATMTYSVAGTGGCATATATRAVTVTANPTISALSDTTRVCGTSTVLNAGAGYSSYSWSNGATAQTITVTSGGF